MVTSIRMGVDRAVNSMGEVTEKVTTGVELSNEAGASLNEIVGTHPTSNPCFCRSRPPSRR